MFDLEEEKKKLSPWLLILREQYHISMFEAFTHRGRNDRKNAKCSDQNSSRRLQHKLETEPLENEFTKNVLTGLILEGRKMNSSSSDDLLLIMISKN